MSSLITRLRVLIFSALILVTGAVSQESVDSTIWVKVTYYDFHSDRSNPEFEAVHSGGLHYGMVADTLGKNHKPVIGDTPYLNYFIHKWFVPFTHGDSTIPDYSPRAEYKSSYNPEYTETVTYNGTIKTDHDTSFINKVIKDSIPFTLAENGRYQFKDDDFFPLDNRGFGNEWNEHTPKDDPDADHNFSFTMELNWKFVMREGLVFYFKGDDDVWVFINNKLQLDLGGIHKAEESTISLDNIEGLEIGKTYSLDVFYAERHSKESHILITSNIFTVPSKLFLYGKDGPPDTEDNPRLEATDSITPGVPFTIYAHAIDSLLEWRKEYDSLITWEISPSKNGTISSSKGASTVFTATEPNSEVTVTACFTDPDNNRESKVSITFYVRSKPTIPVYTIRLYKDPGDVTVLTPIGTSDSVEFNKPYPVYGHVFDDKNNWLPDYDSLLLWDISPVENGNLDTNQGVNTVFTAEKAGVKTVLRARLRHPDDPQSYTSCNVELYVKNKSSQPNYIVKLFEDAEDSDSEIKSDDTITISQTDTIYGRVFDISDKHFPDFDKQLLWNFTPVSAGELDPEKGSFTIFTATKFNKYVTVTATFTDPQNPENLITAKAVLFIKPENIPSAYTLKLYDEPGNPEKLKPLGDSVTISAGKSFTIYGHVFDTNDVWVNNLDHYISWHKLDDDENATISHLLGDSTVFKSNKAGTYSIMAHFVDPETKGRPESKKTLYITVKAAKPYSLQIIRDTVNLNNPVPFDTLIFTKDDKNLKIYAIVMDKYGNYLSHADLAQWEIKDNKVATLSSLKGFTTKVIKEANSIKQETVVIVTQDDLIPDTLIIKKAPERITAVLPNPFTPGKDNIFDHVHHDAIDKYYSNIREQLNKNPSVTLILIQTELPLSPLNPNEPALKANYAKVFAYDAVGNIVRRDLKLLRVNNLSEYMYGIIWDAKNDNNRTVGTGSYYFTINAKMINGASFKYTTKAGIKR